MAAYAALVSVMQIIDQLQHHPSPPISIDKQQVDSLTEIVTSLQEFLEGYNSPVAYSDEADPLEMRIADAAYAAEDVIESFVVDTIELRRSSSTLDQESSSSSGKGIDSGEEIRRWNNFYGDVQKVIEEMDSIKKVVMEMMREKRSTAVQAHQPQRNMSFTEKKKMSSVMVGFDDVLLQLLDKLTSGPLYRQVIAITGMGGIGKTTLARNIFQNALVKEYFDICAWVTISQQYSTKEVISEIFYQVTGNKSENSGEELGQELYKYLYGRRYLIIMDDIWSIDVWEEMKFFLGDSNDGSRIIVTTRQSYLTSQLTDSFCIDMKFLDEVSSWSLFSKTVFGEEIFPLQLEKTGKQIVKICRGLPLSIVVIGGLLAQAEHTLEYWKHIEQKFSSIVNSENDDYCLKIMKMSYNHMPAYLKPCFFYMGIFEEDTKIVVSTLIKLWVSEGFLKPENGKSLETIGKAFLEELIDRNLIQIDALGSIGDISFCKMHDLLRDLCLKQAEKERFYHVIGQHSPQGIHNRRRVFCPRGTSDDALKSMSSHVRSITSQDRSVGKVLPNFRLLRILNAYDEFIDRENDFMYCFKDVIHELVNSRYLAITTNDQFPASMNFLWNLQTLKICCDDWAIIFESPIVIWKMSQLRHVDFGWKEIYLPDPPSGDIDTVILENLQTLSGVIDFKLGEEVVERIPNIKKLKIMYQEEGLEIGRRQGDYFSLKYLKCLRKLESFTCIAFVESTVFLFNSTFPHSLRKLSLEFDHPNSIEWEEMLEKIGQLPLLQKLKLTGGCFRSRKWETVEGQFPSLKYFSLGLCYLEHWIIEESSHFPCLEHLSLLGLKELKEIPSEIGEIPTLQSIKLFDCSDSAVMSAKMIVEEQEECQGEQLPFHVQVAIYDEKQKELLRLANPNFEVHVIL